MTPVRIALEGFLCYRDRQEACFEGRSLWTLAGANGSGKSALLDAMTFALYGLHRGGRQNAHALINRYSDGLVVEFDFLLGDVLYQARRTLKWNANRSSVLPTWQVRRWIPQGETGAGADDTAGGRWEEVPGTDGRSGFDAWVREHIGLTEETFTASVMLRQGQADRLLNEKPAQRHAFLAEVVGLERFRRLHDRARERFRSADTDAKLLSRRLDDLPAVSDEAIQRADEAEQQSAGAAREAAERAAMLSERLTLSRQWQKLDERRRELQARDAELDRLLADRERIEAQARRLELLDRHLDRLADCVRMRQQLAATAQDRDEIVRQERALDQQRERLERAAAQTKAALAARAQDAERLESLRQRVERERMELDAALPWLRQLHDAQAAVRQADDDATAAEADLRTLQGQREMAAFEAPTEAELQAADAAWQQARDRLSEAAARCRQAEERWRRFRDLAHERTCRHCGQTLPAEHVAAETRRLDAERAESARLCQTAQADRDAAGRARDELQATQRTADAALRQLDNRLHALQVALTTARQRRDDNQNRINQTRARIPDGFRGNGQPTDDRKDFNGLKDLKDLKDLKNLERRGGALAEQLRGLEAELAAAQNDTDRLRQDQCDHEQALAEIDQERHGLTRRAAVAEARRQSLAEQLAAGVAALPEPWQAWPDDEAQRQAAEFQRERQALHEADVTARQRALREAQALRQTVQAQLADASEQITLIPELARRDPCEVHEELESARVGQADRERAHREAEARLTELRRVQAERRRLAEQFRAADRSRHLWGRLAELLGRDRLQRELVRRAEREVVDYANAILDRLSAGTLRVELRTAEGGGEQALDLVAHTTSSPDPLDVDYLSGSQKFRVAVALALAIGQYAGSARRPVRSVVIDEGFGSLDAENRQVMIQELQSLREHLDRIILISHQEEFAGVFPDGYHCEATPEGTQLLPFHR